MTDTFNWKTLITNNGRNEFVVSRSKFGDGYSQEVPQGLNNEAGTYTVSVEGYEEEIQPIVDFIKAKKGGESFYWKPPLQPLGTYICTSYSVVPSGGNHYVVTATFERVFRT